MHVRSPEAVHRLKVKNSQTSCSLRSRPELTWACCVLYPGVRVSTSPLNRSEEPGLPRTSGPIRTWQQTHQLRLTWCWSRLPLIHSFIQKTFTNLVLIIYCCNKLPQNVMTESERNWNGNLLQYSYLNNPMDRGNWGAIVHGVAKSGTPLRD